jgi:tRNA threonylcarbamoyladenosine biosynthesis protein TsaE
LQISFHIREIQAVAKELLASFPEKRCFAFYAEMGSGKTTLIHALCKELNVIDSVSSPTFSIINEYKTSHNHSVFHMDWYRLKNIEDAIETGVQDIINDASSYIFIEWPEIAASLLPHDCLQLKLSFVSPDERLLVIN